MENILRSGPFRQDSINWRAPAFLRAVLHQVRPGYESCLGKLAEATGLEPAASCVTGRRSNQLNYAPAYYVVSFLAVSSDALSFPAVPFGRAVTALRE